MKTVAPTRKISLILVGIWAAWPAVSRAQQPTAAPPEQAEELAKKLANPVSDLVSVPFQFNWEQNVGPNEQTRFILNVQPVMPFALNKDWNLITRVIFSRLSSFGAFPASYQIGFGGFAVHPDVGPSWNIRAAVVILLPRARK